jgi:hypothetical protein
MRMITTRLDRLEQRRGAEDQRQAQNNADASWVTTKLAGLAAVASDNGTKITPADRQRWQRWSAGFLADEGRAA